MSSSYEFWLTDDAGRRILLLKDISFCSFTRTTVGYPTIQIGLPYDAFESKIAVWFQPDWRIDAYRSPAFGIPKRREGSFFLRKPHVYDRTTDHLRMIEFIGRGPLDILRRASVAQSVASYYNKTDEIDDMMKQIVTEQIVTPLVAPAGEFNVDGNVSLGPIVPMSFHGRNVLDVLKDLKATSIALNYANPANRKIYFDVVEGPGLSGGFGYVFRTYADLRGTDRTSGLVFSAENGNLEGPDYSEDYLDEITAIQIGAGVTLSNDSEKFLSRWNNISSYQSPSTDAAADLSRANQALHDGAALKSLATTFLNTPGSSSQPRSLYGVDWDLGDLLPVQYAGKAMTAEVSIVYIAIDENGKESITGSNIVGAPQ